MHHEEVGAPAPLPPPDAAPTLERAWTFTPSQAPFWIVKARIKIALRRSIAFPANAVLKSVSAKGPWALYFVYAPKGEIEAQHRYCLERLRTEGFAILVVVAGMTREAALQGLGPLADALISKALPGFDFSAYSLGLWWLARQAPGCDVLVLNDSVFGPFADLRPMLARAQWRLTAFTGSGVKENHIQSYAFMIKDLTAGFLLRLSSVLNKVRAFNRFDDVVLCQELRLGRIAARSVAVGANWYARAHDPTLHFALELLDDGFPFIKRSLLGKHAQLQPQGVIRAALEAREFPTP